MSYTPDKSRLTNAMGRNLTVGLFFETALPGGKPEGERSAIYSLKDRDHTYEGVTYPSLYLLYMEEEDLTEYNFAMKYLNGWSHWQEIAKATWFKEYAKRWREELYLKVAARALNQIKSLSKTTSRDAFQAQRYLIEKGWVPKESTKGRPSKEQVQQEAKRQAQDQKTLNEDFSRLFITTTPKGQLN